jgi:hypothetical protein
MSIRFGTDASESSLIGAYGPANVSSEVLEDEGGEYVSTSLFPGDLVSTTGHYRFLATGDVVRSSHALRFRSAATLAATLADAGFTVESVYGDWDRRPTEPTSRELIVVASR